MQKNLQQALFAALIVGAAAIGWGRSAMAGDPFSSDYNFIDLTQPSLSGEGSSPAPPLEISIDESGSATSENLVVEVTGTLDGDNIEAWYEFADVDSFVQDFNLVSSEPDLHVSYATLLSPTEIPLDQLNNSLTGFDAPIQLNNDANAGTYTTPLDMTTPEPGSLVLFASALGGLGALRRRRKRG